MSGLIRDISKDAKIGYLNQILYGKHEDLDQQYVLILNIMEILSNHDQYEFFVSFLAKYFQSWYVKNSIEDEGQPGEPDFLEGQLKRFLSAQSDEFVMSLFKGSKTKSKKSIIKTIINNIMTDILKEDTKETYNQIIDRHLNLNEEQKLEFITKNFPKHWYKPWDFDSLDDIFMGQLPIVPPNLFADKYDDHIIDLMYDSVCNYHDKILSLI